MMLMNDVCDNWVDLLSQVSRKPESSRYLTVEVPDIEDNLAIYRPTVSYSEWETKGLLGPHTGEWGSVAAGLPF